MSHDDTSDRVSRRTLLASTAALTGILAGCGSRNKRIPGGDSNETTTRSTQTEGGSGPNEQQASQLADCRSQKIGIVNPPEDAGGVGRSNTDLVEREVQAAISQINDRLGLSFEYAGLVAANPKHWYEISNNNSIRDLQLTDLTGAIAQGVRDERGDDGLNAIITHDFISAAGIGDGSGLRVPGRWRHGDALRGYIRDDNAPPGPDNQYLFLTTLGPMSGMDIDVRGTGLKSKEAASITIGREMEVWQAVGRLFGASPFDGGYNIEYRDAGAVVNGITPMATRHVYDRHGGRDHPRQSLAEPLLRRSNTYDPETQQTVLKHDGDATIPLSPPNFVSDRDAQLPAPAEHLYGNHSERNRTERYAFGPDPVDDSPTPIMRKNHVKEYTDHALTEMARALANKPAVVQPRRPPTWEARCARYNEERQTLERRLSGMIADDFEDEKAFPGERDGTGSGPAWKSLITQTPQEDPPGVFRPGIERQRPPGNGEHVLPVTESYPVGWHLQYPGFNAMWRLRSQVFLPSGAVIRALNGENVGKDGEVFSIRFRASSNTEQRFTAFLAENGLVRYAILGEGLAATGRQEGARTRSGQVGVKGGEWFNIEVLHMGSRTSNGAFRSRMWKVGDSPSEFVWAYNGFPDTEAKVVLSATSPVHFSFVRWEVGTREAWVQSDGESFPG
jgi:hypothetical protein